MSDIDIKWERLSGSQGPALFRTAVPGGWLVASGTGEGAPLVFLPDDDQDWAAWEEDDDDDYDEEDE